MVNKKGGTMALQDKDKKKKNEAFNEAAQKCKSATLPVLAVSLFFGGFMAIPFTADFPNGMPSEDNDLYTGFMQDTQNYSYVAMGSIQNSIYDGFFLMRNEEGYELYEPNEYDHHRMMLVTDEARVREIMGDIITDLQEELRQIEEDALRVSPFAEDGSPFITCDYMSAPFEYMGGIERYQSTNYKHDCDRVNGTVSERHELTENNLALWQEALSAIEADPARYQVNPDDIVSAEAEGADAFFFKTAGSLTLLFAGLGMGAVGGISYTDRRRREKQKALKP